MFFREKKMFYSEETALGAIKELVSLVRRGVNSKKELKEESLFGETHPWAEKYLSASCFAEAVFFKEICGAGVVVEKDPLSDKLSNHRKKNNLPDQLRFIVYDKKRPLPEIFGHKVFIFEPGRLVLLVKNKIVTHLFFTLPAFLCWKYFILFSLWGGVGVSKEGKIKELKNPQI
jgi:hypothetical protein